MAECADAQSGHGGARRGPADVACSTSDSDDVDADHLAALAAACPLLVLVPDGDMRAALGALQAGARGCVSQSSPADVLLAEMQVAAHGETVIPRPLAQQLLRSIDTESGEGGEPAASAYDPTIRDRLTSRELEVLGLVARGWDNAHIGAVLFISPRTVKNHIASILEKLGLENRVQAAVCAVRSGIADGNGAGAAAADPAPISHHVA